MAVLNSERPIGHDTQLSRAGFLGEEVELPPSLLIHGPAGIGKGYVAGWLAAKAGCYHLDWLNINMLTARATEDLLDFSRHRPMKKLKVISVSLDRGQPHLFNRLLKLSEEPPPAVHIIFRSSKSVPATIASRSQKLSLASLSDEALIEVLVDRLKWKPAEAVGVAPLAQGSLDGALEALELLRQKDAVEIYLKAVAKRDGELGLAALRSFRTEEDGRLALLLARVWCGEAVSGRWRVFSPDGMAVEVRALSADSGRVRALYQVLCQPGRPRVVARAALSVV